jgi:hypothetical protein
MFTFTNREYYDPFDMFTFTNKQHQALRSASRPGPRILASVEEMPRRVLVLAVEHRLKK